MESVIDNFLDNVFGGVSSSINLVFGAILFFIGVAIFIFSKNKPTKRSQTVGWVFIVVGLVGVLSGLFQSLLS